MIHRFGRWQPWLYVPAPGCAPPERAPRASVIDLGLRVFADKPGHESAELFPAGDIGTFP